ncbi:CHAT domain-containing protein [Aliterella atlantica]|uniref:CHAT domain-containing protein n=1 Tax=Aliterella atlantica TaxID=1827278 RepID=UPI000697ED4C|nr:CHAT domain-containing protein [Aliterella atlantica]
MRRHLNNLSLLAVTSLLLLSPIQLKNLSSIVQAQTIQERTNSAKWQEFSTQEGGFSVLLPGKPQQETKPIEPGSGTLNNFFVDLKYGTYGVSYADFPNASNQLDPKQVDDLLNSVRDSAVGKGKLLTDRNITLDGYKGKEIEYVSAGLTYKTRIYWVKQRLYQQIVVLANPKLAANSDRFFNSFKLLAPTVAANSNLDLAQTGRQQLAAGQFKTALTTLQQALAIAKSQNDKAGIATILNNLGEAYRGQGDYVQALDSYQQALQIVRAIKDKTTEGTILNNIGLAYQGQSQYDQALKFHQQALAIHKQTNNRAMLGISLNNIGLIYYSRGDYAQALQSFEQALTIQKAANNRLEVGTALSNIGLVYTAQGKFDRALESFEQALAIHKAAGNKATEGTILNNIGLIYYSRSQYPQALDAFQQAVNISKDIGNRSGEATSLANVGLTYTAQGEYVQALATYQPALKIAQTIGDRAIEGAIITSMGLVYVNQSQYAQALNSYQQALAIAGKIGDKASGANIRASIGEVYLNQSQYPQALESYQQALVIAREIGNRAIEGQILSGIGLVHTYRAEYAQALTSLQQGLAIYQAIGSPAGAGRLLNNIGLVYQGQSRYAEALKAYQQALTTVRAIGDKAGEAASFSNIGLIYDSLGQYNRALDSYQQALKISQTLGNRSGEGTVLNNIGGVYLRWGNYPQALKNYEQALALLQAVGNRAGIGTTLNNIGEANRLQGKYPQALASYQKGLAITKEISNRAIEGTTLNNIGEINRFQGKYTEALASYQQALVIHRAISNRLGEGQTLTNIGFTLFKSGKTVEAQKALENAIATLESLRPGLSDANKVSIFDTQAGIYPILQQILIARNQPEPALEIAERGRARAFLELLATRSNAQTVESVPLPNIGQIRQIAKQQQATLVEYSVISDEFEIEGRIQQRQSELYIWVVKPTGEVIFRRSDLKPLWQQKNTSLLQLVTNSRQAIPGRSRSSLQQLYQLLIAPIADQLPTNPAARVIFIPQGALFLAPFPALQQANGKYLIEQHTILTSPSIQLLEVTHRRSQQGSKLRNAVVVGNPIMPKVAPEVGATPVQLPSLPAAEQEAKAIAPLLKTQAITGSKATKAEIVSKLPNSRIVHLATHGLLDDVRGLGSAIALAPTSKDNGLFTAEEILGLKLNADLVVMSACNTGRGQITGDGIIGLSRSWISAGVSSVIVSLWLVPDTPTATLMTNFYQTMQKNPDKAQALRQAMLTTMKQHPNPRDWAAFTLIGEAD